MGAAEGASPEKNRAERASGVRVVNADEAAGSGFVDGHFRDDGDAYMSADHREEAGKVATFKNDAGMEAGAVAGGDRSFAEAVSIAENKKRIEAQIGGPIQRTAKGLGLDVEAVLGKKVAISAN